jgi:hypothetical protein
VKRLRPPQRLTANTTQAKWLNKLRDCVESMLQTDAPNARVIETTRGTSIVANPKGKGGGEEGLPTWLP